jgi:uncharacterized protein YndB with AHSA1/START domain
VDDVFRAIDDPSRRLLLDRLFGEDGQTLTELCRHLPDMTRFGVMSHLRVLEDAGLVTTRKAGRNKHHYLNPVPIRLVHDRWISKYARPVVGALAGLKSTVEGAQHMSKPSHLYQAYIAAPREEVWRAMTDGDLTVQYFYGTRVESSWEPGSPLRYAASDGTVVADGKVIAFEPPSRLEITFHARWDPELEAEGPVREVWSVTDAEGATLLTVELWDLDPAGKTLDDFAHGLPFIVSGLKTLVETGKPLAAA